MRANNNNAEKVPILVRPASEAPVEFPTLAELCVGFIRDCELFSTKTVITFKGVIISDLDVLPVDQRNIVLK